MSSAATRPTHSSSSTSKLKTADSNKSYQYDDEAKLTGIIVHEYPLNAVDDTFPTTPKTPYRTNTSFSERAITSSDGSSNNKLRIEMQQTVELTSLSVTPEEQARAQHNSILPASLWRSGEGTVATQDLAPVASARKSSASPSASATASTTVIASASA